MQTMQRISATAAYKQRPRVLSGLTAADLSSVLSSGRRVMKLLSEDPDNYPDAPREGIRRILEEVRP